MDDAKPPPHVYKYRPVDKFTSDIFCRGVLWFSRPDSFNDPYDCLPVLDATVDRAGFRSHLMSAWAELHSDWTPKELVANVNQQVDQSWPLDQNEIDRFKDEYEQQLKSVGVFSTSARYDSVVMWSHYADKHRGICIELDPRTMPDGMAFRDTKYRAERPVINLFRDWKSANRIASGVKSCEWGYEREWRLVACSKADSPPFPCEVQLPDGMLTAVILGERIAEDDRERVVDWCKHLPAMPKIYNAQLDARKFQVNRILVES